MILSAIDIGTNTILMVTLRADASGAIEVLGDEHAIARLGKGVDATRTILPETIERVGEYLLRYRTIAESHGADRIMAFGTSALRDARNRDELIAMVRERTGITIDVLSGEEEATWTYRGALFGLEVEGQSAVLDIGGGSTELAIGDGVDVASAISLDIGAVRLTERFFPALPPGDAALSAARAWAEEVVTQLPELTSGTRLVGVAGTVTTLGAIAQGLARFNAEELNGTLLTLDDVDAVERALTPLTHAETAAIPQIASGRADIILGGTVILGAVMRHLGADAITVSTRGVRYGIALRELERQRLR